MEISVKDRLYYLKRAVLIGLYTLIGVLLMLWLSSLLIQLSTRDQIYQDPSLLPPTKVALVLGTASSVNGRDYNSYFYYRIEKAAELYKQGKIQHFLLSGDNSSNNYNEPKDMKQLLVNMGVPSSKITLDYAGFRTLDSVVRAKEIFGQNEICIITQAFHTPRALYIANYYDMKAVAINAKVTKNRSRWLLLCRESLAKVKTLLDLHIFGTKPKYLGEKIEIKTK